MRHDRTRWYAFTHIIAKYALEDLEWASKHFDLLYFRHTAFTYGGKTYLACTGLASAISYYDVTSFVYAGLAGHFCHIVPIAKETALWFYQHVGLPYHAKRPEHAEYPRGYTLTEYVLHIKDALGVYDTVYPQEGKPNPLIYTELEQIHRWLNPSKTRPGTPDSETSVDIMVDE